MFENLNCCNIMDQYKIKLVAIYDCIRCTSDKGYLSPGELSPGATLLRLRSKLTGDLYLIMLKKKRAFPDSSMFFFLCLLSVSCLELFSQNQVTSVPKLPTIQACRVAVDSYRVQPYHRRYLVTYSYLHQIYIYFVCFGTTNNKFLKFSPIFLFCSNVHELKGWQSCNARSPLASTFYLPSDQKRW